MGGTSEDIAYSISVDGSGNVYTTGYFQGTADFDPSLADTFNLTTAGWAVFISKLNANGNFVWAKKVGENLDIGYSIAVDDSENVYTTGCFIGTADFDPGVGTYNLTSAGWNVFISKLDANGDFLWAKNMGGGADDIGSSIALDGSGNVYTAGSFQGTADFDPGTGTFNLTTAGGSDVFISKLNVNGDFLWAKKVGGTNTDEGQSIAVDGSGNVYTAGNFLGTSDFDPGTGTFNLTSTGGTDVFVVKLTCQVDSTTDFITACDSYAWIDGNTYTADNSTATHTLTNMAGCDSVVILNLTINNSDTGTDFITACDSYTWIDGNTYTSSNNVATFNIVGGAASGCDSLVTLDLTINNSTSSTDTQTACDSFIWIDGNTYTASNNTATYTIAGGAANGCDSLVTLDLTINSISDLSVSLTGATITSNNTLATYQWLDCDSNYAIISGEIGQTFTAAMNGNYAVELTENGCVDTSACTEIIGLGIDVTENNLTILTYPNPAKDKVQIIIDKNLDDVELILTDARGSVFFEQHYDSFNSLELELPEAAGVYFLVIRTTKNKHILKLVKE